MMGPDCERICSGIDAVKDALCAGISALAYACDYQLTTMGEHGEAEIPNPASGFVSAAVSAMGGMRGDMVKMQSLNNELYVSASEFNNSYGSPWKELLNLQVAVNALPPADSLTWRGHRTKLLCLMAVALSRAVDAKWAMVTYHDYVQRGFDNKFNGNEPSLTFKESVEKDGIGNSLNQDYDENVNIPTPPIDPF